jgi:site-specific DNA-methyltransferase (adenine-specific)
MTTAAVSKRMGRRYISFDNNQTYCDYGQRRVNNTETKIGDIELAAFDKKPPRVTFSEMIEAGYFFEGEKLYFNNHCYLLLTKEGKGITTSGEVIDIHSGIAKIKGGSSQRLNGWDYWQVKRNNDYVGIDTIRQRYIKEVMNYE